ncbi:hypothetical protein BDR06DRAFT_969445 [Suillus hirtellus]|nr:hypothetical protein BDR06DRAFT_969445 [Suillus hirtellus]
MIAQKLPPLQHKVSFYFEERWDQAQSDQLSIYHQFKLNANSKPQDVEPDVRDVYIQERWNFCHSPPFGQFYDTSTQQLKTSKSSVMLAVQAEHYSLVVILLSRPRPTEVPPMFLPPTPTVAPVNSIVEAQVPPAVDSNAEGKEIMITVELEGRMQTFVLRLHLLLPILSQSTLVVGPTGVKEEPELDEDVLTLEEALTHDLLLAALGFFCIKQPQEHMDHQRVGSLSLACDTLWCNACKHSISIKNISHIPTPYDHSMFPYSLPDGSVGIVCIEHQGDSKGGDMCQGFLCKQGLPVLELTFTECFTQVLALSPITGKKYRAEAGFVDAACHYNMVQHLDDVHPHIPESQWLMPLFNLDDDKENQPGSSVCKRKNKNAGNTNVQKAHQSAYFKLHSTTQEINAHMFLPHYIAYNGSTTSKQIFNLLVNEMRNVLVVLDLAQQRTLHQVQEKTPYDWTEATYLMGIIDVKGLIFEVEHLELPDIDIPAGHRRVYINEVDHTVEQGEPLEDHELLYCYLKRFGFDKKSQEKVVLELTRRTAVKDKHKKILGTANPLSSSQSVGIIDGWCSHGSQSGTGAGCAWPEFLHDSLDMRGWVDLAGIGPTSSLLDDNPDQCDFMTPEGGIRAEVKAANAEINRFLVATLAFLEDQEGIKAELSISPYVPCKVAYVNPIQSWNPSWPAAILGHEAQNSRMDESYSKVAITKLLDLNDHWNEALTRPTGWHPEPFAFYYMSILHHKFFLEVVEKFYPEGIGLPVTTLPAPTRMTQLWVSSILLALGDQLEKLLQKHPNVSESYKSSLSRNPPGPMVESNLASWRSCLEIVIYELEKYQSGISSVVPMESPNVAKSFKKKDIDYPRFHLVIIPQRGQGLLSGNDLMLAPNPNFTWEFKHYHAIWGGLDLTMDPRQVVNISQAYNLLNVLSSGKGCGLESSAQLHQYIEQLQMLESVLPVWPPSQEMLFASKKFNEIPPTPPDPKPKHFPTLIAHSHLKALFSSGKAVIAQGTFSFLIDSSNLPRDKKGFRWLKQSYVPALRHVGEWQVIVLDCWPLWVMHTSPGNYENQMVFCHQDASLSLEKMRFDDIMDPVGGTVAERHLADEELESFVIATLSSLIAIEEGILQGTSSLRLMAQVDLGVLCGSDR